MKHLFLLFAFCCGTISTYVQDEENLIQIPAAELGKLYKSASFNRVSVHDPSIVVDNSGTKKKYYVYGSHRASASSSDMKNWSNNNWSYGVVNGSRITTVDYRQAFATNMTKKVRVLQGTDTVEVAFGNFDGQQWRYTANNADLGGNQWAPDVIWNPYMDKWCLYMSLNGDNWRSVIALMTADQITGPYIYQGPVVYSGFHWTDLQNQTWKQTDFKLVPGLQQLSALPGRYLVGGSWGNRWPNNIDPCVFFDDDEQMWMSYGSWSGGIFILKLDKNTGLRDYTVKYTLKGSGDDTTQDPYFGTKIAGGHYVSGEGSYIEKIGKYYYLFMSYGGLESNKGYEMRYFRSSNPDGPYKDAKGTSAIFTTYQMNYGPSANSNAGNRLFGSYKWQSMGDAEVAQGHNSALLDDDGRAYLIYHTRFANGGEGHQVRVHQLFQNASGWLVAAPYEFVGSPYNQDSIESRQICSADEIAGTYQLILHPYRIDFANKAYQKESEIYLDAEGNVSGDYTGSWTISIDNTSYILLKLAKKGSTAQTQYTGVVLPQQVSGTNMPSVSFMAVSTNGVAVWGTNVDGKYAVDYNYQKVKDKLPFKAYQQVTSDLDLTVPTYYGAEVTWTSDQPNLISNEGKLMVTPTSVSTDPNIKVTMTYRIRKDNYYCESSRTVRVRCSEADAIDKIYAEDDVRDGIADGIYTLSGVRVDSTASGLKGIYIVNGRKKLLK